jgi:hypothetical protein
MSLIRLSGGLGGTTKRFATNSLLPSRWTVPVAPGSAQTLGELCKRIHLKFDIRNTEGARDYIGAVLNAQASAQPSAAMGGSEVACIRMLLKHLHTKDDSNDGVRTMNDKLTKRFVADGYPTYIALYLVAVDSEYSVRSDG